MKGSTKLKALVAVILIVTLLCGSGALAASYGAKVFSASMNVYNSSGTRIGVLGRGTSITVTSISGSRVKISYRGHTGYAKLGDVVFNQRAAAVTTKASSITFLTKSSYRKHKYYTGRLAAGVTIYLAGSRGGNYIFFDKSGNTMGVISKSVVQRL